MWRTLRQSGWPAACLCWLAGALLTWGPPNYAPQLQSLVDDLMRPGLLAVRQWPANWNIVAIAALVPSTATQPTALQDQSCELKRARDEALWWQERYHVALASAMHWRSQNECESLDDASEHKPLIGYEPLTATLLLTGSDDPLREPLLALGAAHGIAADQLVLADAPHLDVGESRAGEAALLEPDQLVLSGRSVIGRISRVGRWTSAVQLVTDPQFRSPARLARTGQGSDQKRGEVGVVGAAGILTGHADGRCRLTLISADEPVAVGDAVITSARDSLLDHRLTFGYVSEATLREGAPHWEIIVQPARRPDRHDQVVILRETVGSAIADRPVQSRDP